MKSISQFIAEIKEEIHGTFILCKICVPKTLNLRIKVLTHKLPKFFKEHVSSWKSSKLQVCTSHC